MIETIDEHEGIASRSEGTSTRDSPETALEGEVIEVAPGNTAVACLQDERGRAGRVRYASGDRKSR